MQLTDVNHNGEVFFVDDVIDVEEDVLKTLNNGESIGDYTFVDRLGDGTSGGFDRHFIIFQYKDHFYKVMVIRYLEVANNPQLTFTRPYRVYASERVSVRKVYSHCIRKSDDAELVDELKKESDKTGKAGAS